MKKRSTLPLLSAAVFAAVVAAVVAAPSVAYAQRRSPLEDAPAVRKRVELRSTRFEVGAGLGTSINQTFYHAILVNVRLGFHLSDWLSISAFGAFNVASPQTGFQDQLQRTLPADPTPGSRDPTRVQERSALNKMSMMLGGQLELTPFTGKFSIAGKLFAHYDFYFFGGVGAVSLVNANSGAAPACSDQAAPMGSCVVKGMKLGATYGIGFHSYFNDFIGLGVELRDILAGDNPAGRDVNGDQSTDNHDLTLSSHLAAFFTVTAFLPATPDISD